MYVHFRRMRINIYNGRNVSIIVKLVKININMPYVVHFGGWNNKLKSGKQPSMILLYR